MKVPNQPGQDGFGAVMMYSTRQPAIKVVSTSEMWGFHDGEYGHCRLLGYKTQFVPHRENIPSPLHSPASM
jgi:hypothetical protein